MSTLVMTALMCLGGCQSGLPPPMQDPDTISQGTRRVVITFSIAQGMAKSYITSGRATRPGLIALMHYDQAAMLAMREHVAHPSWTSLATAAASVGALMDYTTRADSSLAPPGHDKAAASR